MRIASRPQPAARSLRPEQGSDIEMYGVLSVNASSMCASLAWFLWLGAPCITNSQTPPTQVLPTPSMRTPVPPPRTSAVPEHVMSLSLCTDALLLDLLPPERITSVTYLAHLSTDPSLAAQAARVGTNHGDAEEVLAEAPDLVLAGTYSTPAVRELLRRLGAPLLVVPPANDFAEIRGTVRRVAQAVGAEPRAEALLARMDATLAALARARPPRPIRVADWSGDGFVPGRGSLFDAVLTAAGGIDIAAPAGGRRGFFDIEQLLAAHPDVLAYASGQVAPALKTDTADHPLLLRLYRHRRIAYPELFVDDCGLPESADAARALQRELWVIERSGGAREPGGAP
jgi:iron complex transport system substrate-binding protein